VSPPTAADIGPAKRVAALGKAIVHANAKPVSELQKRILVGSARRLGLTAQQQEDLSKTETVLAADAELLKLEAQLAVQREIKKL
jgi:hypothetical protein